MKLLGESCRDKIFETKSGFTTSDESYKNKRKKCLRTKTLFIFLLIISSYIVQSLEMNI